MSERKQQSERKRPDERRPDPLRREPVKPDKPGNPWAKTSSGDKERVTGDDEK